MSHSFDPEPFVQRQLDAYNARDLDRFLAEYTDDVVALRLPGEQIVANGKAAFGDHYAKNRFSLPGLHAELLNRMVFGNKVVDHERIVGVGNAPMEVAAVYEVTPLGIRRVWFLAA